MVVRPSFPKPLLVLAGLLVVAGLLLLFTQQQTTQPEPSPPPVTPTETTPTSAPSTECGGEITPTMTEGSYYKAGSPEKNNLREEGVAGEALNLTGYVFNKNCQPIAGAWLDFWQADGEGNYDNAGFKLRGHQLTDSEGRYRLETVIPGEYPGRTPHIHVKVRAPDRPTVTTQLYFPDQARNQSDSIFREETLVNLTDGTATFNFVLDVE